MDGESEAAWCAVLDDLLKRGLKQPVLAIVDGASGRRRCSLSLWSDLVIQPCTVHKLRDLIAHAPKRLAGGSLVGLFRHDQRQDGEGGGNASQFIRK